VNSKAIDILNLLDEMGKKQFMPSIGPIKGKIISDIIREYKPKKDTGNWHFVWIFGHFNGKCYV
jgi:hypothetical protein